VFEVDQEQEASPEIEFLNRANEIQYITNPFSPPYMLISAPPGYGKTRLLKMVEVQFKRQDWLCLHCVLDRDRSYTIKDIAHILLNEIGLGESGDAGMSNLQTPEEYGFGIAHALVKYLRNVNALQPALGILILIDCVEALDVQVSQQLVTELVPSISDGLRVADYPDQLKVILAGRYVSHLKHFASETPLSEITVTPFDFQVVKQTTQRFSSISQTPFAQQSIQEIASHLMYLTGGHPGCMVTLLENYPAAWPAEKYLLGKESEHYTQVVEPVIEGIREHLPETLREIFDTLSVVRYFNSRFLRHLIDARLIRWPKSEYELEEALLQTHLVARTTSGFLHDAIAQKLLSIRLRKQNMDHFIDVCKEAITFYEKSLRDPTVSRPDIMAIELLFQKLQYFSYTQNGGKEAYFESVPGILNQLVQGRDARELLQNCHALLKEDWELRFAVNYLLRENVYNHEVPYNELIHKVATFDNG
jgi:hypothetical protein